LGDQRHCCSWDSVISAERRAGSCAITIEEPVQLFLCGKGGEVAFQTQLLIVKSIELQPQKLTLAVLHD
jgi:hypothetical protein